MSGGCECAYKQDLVYNTLNCSYSCVFYADNFFCVRVCVYRGAPGGDAGRRGRRRLPCRHAPRHVGGSKLHVVGVGGEGGAATGSSVATSFTSSSTTRPPHCVAPTPPRPRPPAAPPPPAGAPLPALLDDAGEDATLINASHTSFHHIITLAAHSPLARLSPHNKMSPQLLYITITSFYCPYLNVASLLLLLLLDFFLLLMSFS